ncbi:unnamed protein product [Heligmosomoides polygyrus]|uniref:Dimer_Tnp_hAT domain-containing protein n=1 Tax=Heligmosomoides polygyrus TaxID=6339 RepID=A0A183F861_HELPZ|nr:unnamed protein product [Heligmosomoides polygyrus]
MEIQQYAMTLKKDRPSFEKDPILWWQQNQGRFLLIFEAAPMHLIAPATSVDCERLFSMAGILYGNKRRGRLRGETARLLLMIKAHHFEKDSRQNWFEILLSEAKELFFSSSSSWSDEKWLRYGRYYDSDSSSESSDTDYDSTGEENSYEENSDAPTLD